MNRFLTKRRAKREPVRPKFELDITNALPKNDDFRTSLIMGSLSKRFSMLREQDDPNSMLGKASDDSVLYPRRQSRLMDFGYTPGRVGLDDIAEVSSIRETASIRPPFAQERSNSFVSEMGYGTDEESLNNGGIMSRARPGEGNVLFGGRQKIYKIPMASDSTLGNVGGMKGRALYEDDVSMSTFQKWRQEERDRIAREQAAATADHDSPGKAAPLSPTFPGSITRQTSSSTSTTSAPYNGRGSTAGTSIASQVSTMPSSTPATTASYASTANGSPALDRTATKNRRLYDHSLNRDIEDQQTTAMSRLNSLAKGKGRNSPPFGRTPSRQGYVEPLRPASPQRTSPTSFPAGPFSGPFSAERNPDNGPPSPIDTFTSPLGSALNPGDRGKATALGAFNKPQPFNEKQYLERQMTLRNDRGGQPAKLNASKEDSNTSMDLDPNEESYQTNSMPTTRARAMTNGSIQHDATTAFSVFHNAANQMKGGSSLQPEYEESDEQKNNFFLARSSSGSDFDNEPTFPPPPSFKTSGASPAARIPPIASFVQPPNHEHPAFKTRVSQPEADVPKPRAQNFSTPFTNRRSNASDSNSIRKTTVSVASVEQDPNNSLSVLNGGLSGLIRTHLRQNSGSSSIYAEHEDHPPVPQVPSKLVIKPREQSPIRGKTDSYTPVDSNASNPFDLEDIKTTNRDSPVSPVEDEFPQEAPTSPKEVKAGRRRGISIIPDGESQWQQELKRSHIRGPSAETIQEQDALTIELAKRQKAIQERLMAAKKETDSTASTPEERPSFGPFRGLELLRNKNSKESIKKESQGQTIHSSKPGKILGLSSGITERPSFQSERWTRDEPNYSSTTRSRSASRPATGRSASQRYQAAESARPSYDRGSSDERPVTRDRKNSAPPVSALNASRSRSNSNQSQTNQRSRSRSGRPKDDDTTSSRGNSQPYPDPPTIPEHLQSSTKTSFEQPNGLHIQTSRSPINGVPFESKGLFPPPQPILSPISSSSGASSPILPIQGNALLSPTLPLSPRQSPNGFSPIPSHRTPVGFPAGVATPPLSESSTPVMPTAPGFPAPPPPPAAMAAGTRARSQSRKRSVQKSEISEPILISTTSVIDTIALPPGASLRNGMDEFPGQRAAPPLPPINPMRRKFAFGKHPQTSNRTGSPPDNQLDDFLTSRDSGGKVSGTYGRSLSSSGSAGSGGSGGGADSGYYPQSSDDTASWRPKHGLRKSSSEGEKLGMKLRAQQELQRQMQMEMTANLKSGIGKRDQQTPVFEGGMF